MPPTEVDPSTLSPEYLSKASKKDLIKYFGDLQGMYAERERKYEKAKRIIRDNKSATAAKSTCAKPPMIPRPRGRASRDYNVYDEMQVKDRIEFDKGMYNNIISTVQHGVDSSFDLNLSYTKQDPMDITKMMAYVLDEFTFLNQYQGYWPVTVLARQYLNNHRQYGRKANKNSEGGQTQDDDATAGANDDGNGGDAGDGNESDGPFISDIDD